MFLNTWFLQCQVVSLMSNPNWSAVHGYLFNIFAANLHIWRPTPPSATRGNAPCRVNRNPRMETNNTQFPKKDDFTERWVKHLFIITRSYDMLQNIYLSKF